jgi:predicted aspartyl protease
MQSMPARSVTLREPRIDVIIQRPSSLGSPYPVQCEVEGLLDTGATTVVIPLAMAQSLGLTKVGRKDIDTPSGSQFAYIYDAEILVPALGQVHEVAVASLIGIVSPGPNSVPLVLLGKSLLQHFHFCMYGPEGTFTLSVPNSR